MTMASSLKLGIDVNWCKEIIVKSPRPCVAPPEALQDQPHLQVQVPVASIIWSLPKASPLSFCPCPKFFNQKIMAHIATKNIISLLDFLLCIIGRQLPEEFIFTMALGSSPDLFTFPHVRSHSSMSWRSTSSQNGRGSFFFKKTVIFALLESILSGETVESWCVVQINQKASKNCLKNI